MQIASVMTSPVELANPAMKVAEAAARMRTDDVGALPVGENDRLVGMVTDRDIVMRAVAQKKSPEACDVREVMSEDIYYVFEDEELSRAAELMAAHQVQRLPVLNRDKRLVGMIALADLARSGAEGRNAVAHAMSGIAEPTGVPRQ